MLCSSFRTNSCVLSWSVASRWPVISVLRCTLNVMLCTVRLSRQESSVSLQSFSAEDALKPLSGLRFKDLANFIFLFILSIWSTSAFFFFVHWKFPYYSQQIWNPFLPILLSDSIGGSFSTSSHRCHHKQKHCLPIPQCGTLSISPLLFHPHTKGSQIIMDTTQKAVKRQASFCNAITFSNRPIVIYEQVRLKVSKLYFSFCHGSCWEWMLGCTRLWCLPADL